MRCPPVRSLFCIRTLKIIWKKSGTVLFNPPLDCISPRIKGSCFLTMFDKERAKDICFAIWRYQMHRKVLLLWRGIEVFWVDVD